MHPETNQNGEGRNNTLLWLAGATGAAVGVASLLYSRRRRSRWDVVKDRATDVARTSANIARASAEEFKPWMGIAAGAAAGVAGLAYWRAQQPTPWERRRERAISVATDTWGRFEPWIGIATTTAISLASAAYSRRDRGKVADAKAGAAAAGAQLSDAGVRLFRSVQRISGEARKLYPRVRRLVA